MDDQRVFYNKWACKKTENSRHGIADISNNTILHFKQKDFPNSYIGKRRRGNGSQEGVLERGISKKVPTEAVINPNAEKAIVSNEIITKLTVKYL